MRATSLPSSRPDVRDCLHLSTAYVHGLTGIQGVSRSPGGGRVTFGLAGWFLSPSRRSQKAVNPLKSKRAAFIFITQTMKFVVGHTKATNLAVLNHKNRQNWLQIS